jgi:hypothetical protein
MEIDEDYEDEAGETADAILVRLSDLVNGFFYYDRKEDAELPRGAIEDAVKRGFITVDEMLEHFEKEFRAQF